MSRRTAPGSGHGAYGGRRWREDEQLQSQWPGLQLEAISKAGSRERPTGGGRERVGPAPIPRLDADLNESDWRAAVHARGAGKEKVRGEGSIPSHGRAATVGGAGGRYWGERANGTQLPAGAGLRVPASPSPGQLEDPCRDGRGGPLRPTPPRGESEPGLQPGAGQGLTLEIVIAESAPSGRLPVRIAQYNIIYDLKIN